MDAIRQLGLGQDSEVDIHVVHLLKGHFNPSVPAGLNVIRSEFDVRGLYWRILGRSDSNRAIIVGCTGEGHSERSVYVEFYVEFLPEKGKPR